MAACLFRKSETRASRLIELVHSDLCGPMPTKPPSGNRYFLTLIDDHSRFTVVGLLKSKDEVCDTVKRNTSRTPYEHFYGHNPAVGHDRVFGSRVFSLVPSERRKKLSARAAEGVLIGYGNRVKGYRLMDPKTARVWYSRSVRIMEEPAQMTLRRRERRPTEHSKAPPQVMVNLDEWESHHKDGSVEDAAVKENQDSTPRRSERLAAKDENA
uniref:Integrase catalytic domain-containing protein n=1 Tax=Trichuris muris TaxID=70415 RepID=A0A5S6R013_TRIMR